jgi:hypothetical protein
MTMNSPGSPIAASAAPPVAPVVPAVPAAMRTMLLDCFPPNSSVDIDNYVWYFKEVATRARWVTTTAQDLIGAGESHSLPPPAPVMKKRKQACVYGRKNTKDGPLEIITQQESLWYMMYVSNFVMREDGSLLREKFRTRFCLPYEFFFELLKRVRVDPRFDKWCGFKKINKRCLPVELLVLGLLRYLGQGWTFDVIKEATAIDANVHHVFFHFSYLH